MDFGVGAGSAVAKGWVYRELVVQAAKVANKIIAIDKCFIRVVLSSYKLNRMNEN